jgi:uncharacterized protein
MAATAHTGIPAVPVRAAPERDESETAAQATWMPADPAPLGLAGFALTTFVLSMFNANLVGSGGEPVVLGVALAYGGLAQLLAGMWEFRRGDTFGALAFTSFAAFWLSFWALLVFYAKQIAPTGEVGKAIGLYLIAWGIFTTYLWLASFRRSVAVNLVLFALAVTFFLLGIGNAGNHTDVIHAGGWAGLVTAALAWYTSFAEVLHSQHGRWILPVIPLTGGPPRAANR